MTSNKFPILLLCSLLISAGCHAFLPSHSLNPITIAIWAVAVGVDNFPIDGGRSSNVVFFADIDIINNGSLNYTNLEFAEAKIYLKDSGKLLYQCPISTEWNGSLSPFDRKRITLRQSDSLAIILSSDHLCNEEVHVIVSLKDSTGLLKPVLIENQNFQCSE